MVHAWVSQKRLKRDISRLFTMFDLLNIYGDYCLMTRNRKRLFKQLNTILTPPPQQSFFYTNQVLLVILICHTPIVIRGYPCDFVAFLAI
jgi:hypothetical protein